MSEEIEISNPICEFCRNRNAAVVIEMRLIFTDDSVFVCNEESCIEKMKIMALDCVGDLEEYE